MPIIRSAKKAARQSIVRHERNKETLSKMKTYIKKVLDTVKAGKKEEAEKFLHMAYSVIDKALKKHVIHKNNAARKKSRLAKAVLMKTPVAKAAHTGKLTADTKIAKKSVKKK